LPALITPTQSWNIAWRLPSFFTAVVLATILFRAAIAAYGAAAASIALGAFGLNLLSVRLATLVRTDMPPASVIFLLGRFGGMAGLGGDGN
jgi:ABC-type uncharacterized transport system permease subunit